MEDTGEQGFADIRALLKEAMQPENLIGSNDDRTAVFNFPLSAKGFARYALRVQNFDHPLMHSSALVPVERLVGHMHIGQALMQLDLGRDAGARGSRLEIIVKQQGISFASLEESMRRAFGSSPRGTMMANIAIMEQVLAMQKSNPDGNPFLSLLDKAYQIETLGFETDYTKGNILLNTGRHTLELVDQTEKQQPLHAMSPLVVPADRLKSLFPQTSQHIDPDLEERFLMAKHRINVLIDTARDQILTKYKDQPQLSRGIAFARVRDVSGIALSEPTHTLAIRLDQLVMDAGIPAL